jgi:transketolase
MISMAGGLAQEGYLAFPCTFDAFTRRFLDQLYVTVAYSNLNVKVLAAYAGLFTGKAGATHQSDKELGVVLRIPRLTVVEPGFNDEMRQVLRVAAETPGPFYLRIVRCEVEDDLIGGGYQFRIGKGDVLDDGAEVGRRPATCHALAAADKLRARAGSVRIDHHPSLKPFDRELLYDLAAKVSAIVTLENHCTSGGLLAGGRRSIRGWGSVGAIGTDPDFIHTGHVNDLLWRYKMSSDDVVELAERTLRRVN